MSSAAHISPKSISKPALQLVNLLQDRTAARCATAISQTSVCRPSDFRSTNRSHPHFRFSTLSAQPVPLSFAYPYYRYYSYAHVKRHPSHLIPKTPLSSKPTAHTHTSSAKFCMCKTAVSWHRSVFSHSPRMSEPVWATSELICSILSQTPCPQITLLSTEAV